MTSNIRMIVHRWARRPFATGGFLSLIVLIAAAGPWACIAHCTSATGAKHAQHQAPRHIIATGSGDTSVTSVAGGIRVFAHRDHDPAVHHTTGDTGGDVVAVPAHHWKAGMSMRPQPAEVSQTSRSSTIHTIHCPPGPTMTALTVAIMLPAAPVLRIIARRLPASPPLSCYTSVDSDPLAPPPRPSQSFAI